MNSPRISHTAAATVLGTGETAQDVILIAGGANGASSLSSYEYYVPSSNTFEYYDDNMIQPRSGHTATALLDGRILIVGGDPYSLSSNSAEIFDPATGECTSTGNLAYPRSGHRATLLQDGRVLITGSHLAGETNQPVAEIYDPKTGLFAATGSMHAARFLHTSTLLPNGKVLITGGQDNDNDGAYLSSAEIFDPATGEFTEIGGGMADGARADHQATLLDNGKVLITGGNGVDNDGYYTSTAEIYDPVTNSFASVGYMAYHHEGHQAALLRDGTVLLIGGNDSGATNEIFDPLTSTFRPTGPMSFNRSGGAAAVLTDGRVLITGGLSTGDGSSTTDTAEVWNPRVPFPTHIISGTITYNGVGVGGVMLVGLPGHPMTNAGGYYEGLVLDGWTGTVTPTKPGFAFSPPSITYTTGVIADTSGQDYTVTSASASKLAFAQQPHNAVVNATMMPPVTVEIQDELGNLITTATNTVALSLAANPGGAALAGTVSKAAVAGVATFNDLSLDKISSGYALTAASSGLAGATSSSFDIIAGGADQAGAPLISTGTYEDMFGPSPTESEHWFKVTVSEGQDIRVSTSDAVSLGPPATLDVDPYVYDESGHLLVVGLSDRPDETVYLSNMPAGTYFIRIWSYANTRYVLTLTTGDLVGLGEISGRITNSLGQGVGNILIEVYPENDDSWSMLQTVGNTAPDGQFRIAHTAGNYKLLLAVREGVVEPSDLYVLSQWYHSSLDFAGAAVVSINAGGTSGGHDDVLADGAAISGQLINGAGEAVPQTTINAYNPDGTGIHGMITSALTTDYLMGHIRIPTEGHVKARFASPGYIPTWYAGKYSLAAADLIPVQARVTTPNINAQLMTNAGGGSIQGRVTDGVNGIPNVFVRASDIAGGQVRNATTDVNGNYTISSLPSFEARVHYDASQTAFASQWYNNKGSHADADPVAVVYGSAVTGINAMLSPKTIQVVSPNGAEGWAVGSTQNITWTSSLGVEYVRIELSTNGGADYSDIIASTLNTGSYTWIVTDTPSVNCLIRISDLAAGGPVDVSNAVFTIAAAGAPRKLAFLQQPTNTTVNATITPAVTVEIQDALGNRVVTATNEVALSLRLVGTAMLSGTLSKAAVAGVATFDDLSVNEAGLGYLLRANSGSLTEVDSSSFAITAPEIGVRQATSNIPDGGSYDFGSHGIGSDTDVTFTIENTGAGALIIGNLPVVVGGTDAPSFSVQQQPAASVSPGGSTTFVIRFSPTSAGAKTASISIANNDADENPYDITFTGTATVGVAAVSGTITFNDSPITAVTGVTPTFLIEDVSTGSPAAFTSTYLNATGIYSISIAPGTYHITTYFDAAAPTDGKFLPGDYYGFLTNVVVPPGGLVLNIPCQRLMHMTSPIDNSTAQTWEFGSLGGDLTFAWDAVPEASKYRLEIAKFTDAGVYEGHAISPADIAAPTTHFSCSLPLSGPGGHYRLILQAFKGDIGSSAMVGQLIVVYDWPNWSNVYRFKSGGLVAYFPFRGNANDESGYGNNGTINGGAVFAADRFGAANGSLTFDGDDDYVDIPNEGWFDLSQITIVAIVKISALETSVPVISKGYDFGSFTLEITNSPGLRPYYTYRISGGNETNPLSGQAVPVDQFFHLAVTYDPATRSLCGYVNGVRKVSLTTATTPVLNDQNVTIGLLTSTPPGPSRHFVGAIDEIRIYNRVLSLAEIQTLYGAAGDGDYEFLAKWGSYGSGDSQFDHAVGIAVDGSGYVYVSDTENNRIQKFTSSGVFVTKWGSFGTGDGQLYYPYGIAVDSSGYIYVADSGNGRIQKFTADGTFVTKWGSIGSGDGQFLTPYGIAIDSSGNVYVSDMSNNRIEKFTGNGAFLAKWGSYGSEDGQFFYPLAIGVDSSGNVYVADENNSRVEKFTADGTFMTKWGTAGSGDGQFNMQYGNGLAVDSSGNIYVADSYNSRIQKFTSSGVFVTKWGSFGFGDGQFYYPYGVAVDGSGYVYVTESNNCRIQKFRKK
jgi:sugar lactone lactonase YvrE